MQINRESILSILAPSLILLSRFLTYILYHDYGILNREVILSLSVICLVGMLVGVPLAITGSSRFRAFGFVILLFIFFDLQFDLINSINQYLADEDVALHRYVILTAALFIVCIIIMMMHEHIATIIATMFAITILTTIVLPNQKVNPGPQPVSVYTKPESDKTPIIHLVLDEHIGIEGLPRDIEGGDELREFLIDFYERWGFRLYGRAYSKYFTTHNSLSNLLNGETSPINAMLANTVYQHGIASWVPVQNDYFTRVTESDYRIRVYQSDYFDFCQNPLHRIEYCFQYLSSSPQLLKRTNLSVTEKAELLLGGYYFSADSSILRVIQGIYNRVSSISYGLLPAWEYKNYEFTSLSGPAVITRLKNDIASNSRGRLFFAHLLLPHYPYVWDADCQLRMNSDTWLTRRLHLKTQTSDTKHRRAAYRYYFKQVVCTVSLLDDLLEHLNKAGLLEDATIIIHGDHGSRITLTDPTTLMLDHVTDSDLIDGFSTLFAIRSDTIEPGYDIRPRSIQNLFGELVLEKGVASDDGNVFLLTGPWIPKLPLKAVPMPDF